MTMVNSGLKGLIINGTALDHRLRRWLKFKHHFTSLLANLSYLIFRTLCFDAATDSFELLVKINKQNVQIFHLDDNEWPFSGVSGAVVKAA